jgi:hypothetical protein
MEAGREEQDNSAADSGQHALIFAGLPDGAAQRCAARAVAGGLPARRAVAVVGPDLDLHTGVDPRHDVAMKKTSQKTRVRSPQLQPQDLAAVRGGENGVIHAQVTVGGGISPHDNGVIHME